MMGWLGRTRKEREEDGREGEKEGAVLPVKSWLVGRASSREQQRVGWLHTHTLTHYFAFPFPSTH